MDDTIRTDIRDLKISQAKLEKGQELLRKGQDTMMEILDGLAAQQDNLEANVNSRFNRLEQRFDKVMTALDTIAGKLADREADEAAATVLLGEQSQQLIEHDRRIVALEKAAI